MAKYEKIKSYSFLVKLNCAKWCVNKTCSKIKGSLRNQKSQHMKVFELYKHNLCLIKWKIREN